MVTNQHRLRVCTFLRKQRLILFQISNLTDLYHYILLKLNQNTVIGDLADEFNSCNSSIVQPIQC